MITFMTTIKEDNHMDKDEMKKARAEMKNARAESENECDEIVQNCLKEMREKKIEAQTIVVCLLKWAVAVADGYGPSRSKIQFLKENFEFWLSSIEGE